MSFFETWNPSEAEWQPLTDGTSYMPVNDQSLPIVLPNQLDTPINLSKFESVATLESEASSALSSPSDVLLHTGGSVWALDWCPATAPSSSSSTANGAGPSTSKAPPKPGKSCFLAVGCHPKDSPTHKLKDPISGQNSIQLWEVAASPKDPLGLPQLPVVIAHSGGLTWSCCWCPSPAASTSAPQGPGYFPRLGLLAAVLGNGSVCIWSVPQPQSLVERYQGPGTSTEPLIFAPPFAAQIESKHLSGSKPCRVDWLPVEPYDLLVIGCWDGTAAVVKLDPTQTDPSMPLGLRLLMHFPADTLPLRCVKWYPAGAASGSIDMANRFMFMTAGHEGTVKVWDARDQFTPVFAHQLSTAVLLDACWSFEPLGIFSAVEEGSFRGLLLDAREIKKQLGPSTKPPIMFIWRGKNAGALMAAAAHPKGGHVAYSGEDGVLGLGAAELLWDHRKRKDHRPVGAMKTDMTRHALRIWVEEELKEDGNGGLFIKGGGAERTETVKITQGNVPDAAQIMHRLAWGPFGSGAARKDEEGAWLAVGGAAGIVRCIWITV